MKQRPTTCDDCRDWLPLYPGAELEPAVAAAIEAHLQSCAECASEWKRLERALHALHAERLPEGHPAPELWPALRSELVAGGLVSASRDERPAMQSPGATLPGAVDPAAPAPIAARFGAERGATRRWRRAVALCALAASFAWIAWAFWPVQRVRPAPSDDSLVERDTGRSFAPSTALDALQPASGRVAELARPQADAASGLRRAAGEERLRDVSMPFDPTPARASGSLSLASDVR
jgi:hypothetical protein